MAIWLQKKYVNLVSSSLLLYKEISTNPFIAVFRCPYCGDSQKKKTKRRGNLFEREGEIIYHCFNCEISRYFSFFLKDSSPSLHLDYKVEMMRNLRRPAQESVESLFKPKNEIFNRVFNKQKIEYGVTLDLCNRNDPVLCYAKKRQIPEIFFKDIHTCENINSIVEQIPRYKEVKLSNEPVLVIPFYDKYRYYSFICCRSISGSSKFRYLNFKINEELPKIFGLRYIDWSQKVFVLEGAIDSMMVPNSLALSGSAGVGAIKSILENSPRKTDIVFIYDNELRSNYQIYQQIVKRIQEGFSVVLFDRKFKSKDINEAVVRRELSQEDLMTYIQERTFQGLMARLELSKLRS